MQKKDWYNALEDGWVVLTVNSRLARYIERCYEQRKVSQGQLIWETPEILPFSAWLQRCWSELLDVAPPAEILLSEEQERIVWEDVLNHSAEKGNLLWTDSAAQRARNAWNILADWSLEPPINEAISNPDATAFCLWAEDFNNKCRHHGWLPRGWLSDYIINSLEHISLPEGIMLAGFDEIIPSQNKLFKQLEKQSIPIVHWQDKQPPGETLRTSFTDCQAEITAAANWARSLIEQRVASSVSDAKPLIGIVVPDLQTMRSDIVRIFSETFYPGRPQLAPFPEQAIFNITLGTPLAEFPMIRDGLKLLSWIAGEDDWRLCGTILSTPYIAGGEVEWSQRGLLDAHLRHQGKTQTTKSELLSAAVGSCPILAERLTKLLEFMDGEGQIADLELSPGRWARLFDQLLEIIGWPGERSLESREFQAMESWRAALGDFAGLEMVLGSIELARALSELKTLLFNTVFQPIEAEAQIHILGVLEAEGERFDNLWILGLSDQVWPKLPDPNPFLPIGFQRKHKLPHSSSERELTYAKRLTNRLLTYNNKIIVSYSERDGDMELRPSPLITHIKAVSADMLAIPVIASRAATIKATPGMEPRPQLPPPPFPTATVVTGGTSLIKSQALCPFSAFAKFRLYAYGLEEPSPGFDARQRGEISHDSLARFWRQVVSSQRLKQMSAVQRDSVVKKLVKDAVMAQAERGGGQFSKAYLQLEINRQVRLLSNWLEFEAGREKDFTALELEAPGSLEIGGITVKFRIDRVDRVAGGDAESGDLVIIDYKTGATNVNHWFSERPEEPQMPIYAISHAINLSDLVYGQLRAGKPGFTGISGNKESLPGVEPIVSGRYDPDNLDWSSILDAWAQTVGVLASSYRLGEARVDPLPNACDWCELALLCRVAELNAPVTAIIQKEGLS